MCSCASFSSRNRMIVTTGIRTGRLVGAMPGSIHGTGCECVNYTIISSTSWSSPTVRNTGLIVMSAGIVGINSCE
jgi:hypothetical protein